MDENDRLKAGLLPDDPEFDTKPMKEPTNGYGAARFESEEQREKSDADKDLTPFPLELVISAPDLVCRKIPKREDIVEGLLSSQSLSMVFAKRGLGKTFVGLSLCDSIARGNSKFLRWDIQKPRRCLYADGELPAIDLQERVKSTCGGNPPPELDLISSEFFFKSQKGPLILNSDNHQKRFLLLLDELEANHRRPEVIVFDNLSSLCLGLDENSNSEQDSFLRYLLELRHRGYTILIFHHTGKTGEQRGASRREDFLDLSIKLNEPEIPSPTGNAKFILEFAKTRRKILYRSPFECELISEPDGHLTWVTREVRTASIQSWVRCLRIIQTKEPSSQEEIALILGVTSGTVSKHVKKARGKALLEEGGLILTNSGHKYLTAIYGEDAAEYDV